MLNWRGEVRGQTAEWAQVWLNGASLWVQLPTGQSAPKGEVTVVVRPERVKLLPAKALGSEQMKGDEPAAQLYMLKRFGVPIVNFHLNDAY